MGGYGAGRCLEGDIQSGTGKLMYITLKRLVVFFAAITAPSVVVASGGMAPTTDNEWMAFEAQCKANANCASELKALRSAIEKYEAEIKAICEKDADACAQRLAQEANEQRLRFATCESPGTCMEELNRNMEVHEKTLEESSWCINRPTLCEAQKQARAQRQAEGKNWCDTYKSICEHALSESKKVAQAKAQQEAAIRMAQQKRQTEKLERENLAILRNLDRWLEQQAVCGDPDATKCIGEINARLAQSEQSLEASYCVQEGAVCRAIKQRRAARQQSKRSWCDEHSEVCSAAQRRAAEEYQYMVDDAERVAKLCAGRESSECESIRVAAYEALLERAAKCVGSAETCRGEIEARIFEKRAELHKGPWCERHREFCDIQSADIGKLAANGEGWCVEHPAACAKAEDQQRAQEHAMRQRERDEALAEWGKRVDEFAAGVAATCRQAEVGDCVHDINAEVTAFLDRSEKSWCNGNPRRAQGCNAIRGARVAVTEKYCGGGRQDCQALIEASKKNTH